MNEYRPAWWLPGPHAVTIWGKFGRKEPAPTLRWERLDTPDGDFLELAHLDTSACALALAAALQYVARSNPAALEAHHVHPTLPVRRHQLTLDTTPRLFVMHGLEGGADANYVRGLMREASARSWNATVMLFRTCGPTPNKATRSYHSGETTDPLLALQHLAKLQPLAPIGAVGYSLGGNVLCKLLGEQGEAILPQLKAAVAVSAPFDLARASRYIGQGFGKVYENAFLRSLVPKARAKMQRHPELANLKPLNDVRTIWDFDDQFTSPVHGFVDAADYYAKSSSLQFLKGIRRPTLLLNAVDDPFLPPAVLDDVRAVTSSNSAITLEFPAHGGHVAFASGPTPARPFYYAEWRAAEFLRAQFANASRT
ncbi:MAG: alpha/beta fold hydrolase [Gemmatimonadaceae bacterium]